MNIINGFIAFVATLLAMIGFVCFVVGGTTIGSGSGRNYYDGSEVVLLFGFLFMGGSILLFSFVVKRWKKSSAQYSEKLHSTIKAELRKELRQEMGLSVEEEPVSNIGEGSVAVRTDSNTGDDIEDL